MKLRILAIATLLSLVFGCSTGTGTQSAKDPAQAVNNVIQGIVQYQPQAIWRALPASYQKDVQNIILLGADATDKEAYDRTVIVAQKAVKILSDKKPLFLATLKKMPMPIPPDEIEKSYDAAVIVIKQLVNSDLSKHDNLKTLNVDKFLSSLGSETLKNLVNLNPNAKAQFDGISKVSASLVSTSGDEAKLEITTPQGTKSTEEFVKIEGAWIPKKMKEGWAPGLKRMEEQLVASKASSAAMYVEYKAKYLPEIEKQIDKLAKVQTEADLGTWQMEFMASGLIPTPGAR